MSKSDSAKKPNDDGRKWIFTTKIRLRNGKILYAHECGLKAFRFRPKGDGNTQSEQSEK